MKGALVTIALILCLASLSPTEAQVFERDSIHSPRKATIYSAIIPGLGQAYNEKYWKIGLIYAGIGGMGVMYATNNREFQRYQSAYVLRIDGDTNTVDDIFPDLSDNAVRAFRDFHRRNRDIAILGFIGIYALQIIDANVDAHLREFRINEELSIRWQPWMNRRMAGLSFSLDF